MHESDHEHPSSTLDFIQLAGLLKAGRDLGLDPYVGEAPASFSARVGDELRRLRLSLALRVALAATLAAFGIASF